MLFRNRDLLNEMQRTELLLEASNKTISVQKSIVRAHKGEEALARFNKRAELLSGAAIQQFSLLKLSRANVVPGDTSTSPGETVAESSPAKPAIESVRHELKLPDGKEITISSAAYNSILRLQARVRGKLVLVAVKRRRAALAAAIRDNDTLFANEYGKFSTEIQNQVVLKKRLDTLALQMPSSVSKLIDGYELRCYWFEIFECGRKLLMTGLPQLLPIFFGDSASKINNMVVGLILSFLTFAVYMGYAPYNTDENDQLSVVCQSFIFFTLLYGLVKETGTQSPFISLVMPMALFLPLAYIFIQKAGLKSVIIFFYKKSGLGWVLSKFFQCFSRFVGAPMESATKRLELPPEIRRRLSLMPKAPRLPKPTDSPKFDVTRSPKELPKRVSPKGGDALAA